MDKKGIEHRAVDQKQMVTTLSALPPTKLNKGGSGTAEEKKEALAESINNALSVLAESYEIGKIPLIETEAIREQAVRYMGACAEAGTYPGMLTFAPLIGYSPRYVYQWQTEHPNHETTHLISILSSLWADVLAQQSLNRMADSITSIFVLKNSGAGLSNDPQEIPIKLDVRSDRRTSAQIAEEFKDLF